MELIGPFTIFSRKYGLHFRILQRLPEAIFNARNVRKRPSQRQLKSSNVTWLDSTLLLTGRVGTGPIGRSTTKAYRLNAITLLSCQSTLITSPGYSLPLRWNRLPARGWNFTLCIHHASILRRFCFIHGLAKQFVLVSQEISSDESLFHSSLFIQLMAFSVCKALDTSPWNSH